MYPKYPLDDPPKLWMVSQIQELRYRPYWEKEAMKEMGLYRVSWAWFNYIANMQFKN